MQCVPSRFLGRRLQTGHASIAIRSPSQLRLGSKVGVPLEPKSRSLCSLDSQKATRPRVLQQLSTRPDGQKTAAASNVLWEDPEEEEVGAAVTNGANSPEKSEAYSGEARLPPSGSKDARESGNNLIVEIQKGGEFNRAKRKVLKINVDLMLYAARKDRYAALKCRNRARKRALYESSELKFRRCIDMDPTDGRAYVGLAKLVEKNGRIDEARAIYELGSSAVGGDNPFIWQAWATLESGLNNPELSRKLFDAATAADKTHAAAWHGWGMLEKREGNLLRARDLFVKGTNLMPPDRPNEYLFQSLAVLASEGGNVEEARLWFRKGTQAMAFIARTSAPLWQAWALMEAKQGNEEEARRLFSAGLKQSPKNRYLWLAWGVWEGEGGNSERARYLLSSGAKLNPLDPALVQAWARLEAREGNGSLARHLFKKGIRIDESHQPLWQAWGMLEWKDGDIEKARELFQQGVWANPKNKDAARVFQAWGVLEEEQGNIGVARQLFKCALKVDSKNVPSWQAWAALEERQGLLRRADDLRSLCLEQRTEEVYLGGVDESVAAGIEALQATFSKLTTFFGPSDARAKLRQQKRLAEIKDLARPGPDAPPQTKLDDDYLERIASEDPKAEIRRPAKMAKRKEGVLDTSFDTFDARLETSFDTLKESKSRIVRAESGPAPQSDAERGT